MKHGFLADLAQARGTQNDGFVPMRLARGVTWFAPDASPEDRQVVRSLIHRTEWQAGGLQLPAAV